MELDMAVVVENFVKLAEILKDFGSFIENCQNQIL